MTEILIQPSLPAPLPLEVLLTEAERELIDADARISVLQDELALLQETHLEEVRREGHPDDGPRPQETVLRESRIAKRQLLIIAQEWRKKELIEEIEADVILPSRIYSARGPQTEQ